MSSSTAIGTVAFPWSNPQRLAEKLKNGEMCLATAISQVEAIVRESLKIIEENASEQIRSNLERKGKVEKLTKLVEDLSEKCQAMQQALLYKEEKYDEKCREVERYKVICELSAKAAVSDDLCYKSVDSNNNNNNVCNLAKHDDEFSFLEEQQTEPGGYEDLAPKKSLKSHAKLSQNQVHLSHYVEPFQPGSNPDGRQADSGDGDAQHGDMAQHYVGGSIKRKQLPYRETKLRHDIAAIGGIISVGPSTNTGPVSIHQLFRPADHQSVENQNKRTKIALVGQSNEVMSSSRNAIHQMKRKFTERDLHRQVASAGCWNRMTSRRKKEWPF